MNLILSLLAYIIVPLLFGNAICGVLKIKLKAHVSFVVGYIGIWALFQIVAVPLVLSKQSFMLVVIAVTAVIAVFSIYGFIKKPISFRIPRYGSKTDIAAFLCLCMVVCVFLVTTIVLQHTDADDSRFVVNAVDIVSTNKMFLVNPATGEEIPNWTWEQTKDVTSPWSVYIAYCSKITCVHPAIVAHTFLPVVLSLIFVIVYWMISDHFFRKEVTYRSIFTIFAILINIYGFYSLYCAETFAVTRIWQGKAVVASIGIPLMYYICMKIYKHPEHNGCYILLYIMNFAMCLMSGMGIALSVMIVASFAIVYSALKRNLKVFLKTMLAALPNVIYFITYLVINEFELY